MATQALSGAAATDAVAAALDPGFDEDERTHQRNERLTTIGRWGVGIGEKCTE